MSKLEKIYFPVKLEKVFYRNRTLGTVLMPEHLAVIGYEDTGETQFAVVSNQYKLITNKEFFSDIETAITNHLGCTGINIVRQNGRFVVTFKTGVLIDDSYFCLKAINSYDTSAATSLNMYIYDSELKKLLLFDADSFKHKHTKGNPFVQHIQKLQQSTEIFAGIKTIRQKMKETQVVDLTELTRNIKLPRYFELLLESFAFTNLYDFYNIVTQQIEVSYSDITKQIELTKQFFRNIVRVISFSNLELETEAPEAVHHIDEETLNNLEF